MRRRVRGAVHSKPSGQMTMSMRNAASPVPTTYHYKRPPRKRKAVALEVLAIVTRKKREEVSKPATHPARHPKMGSRRHCIPRMGTVGHRHHHQRQAAEAAASRGGARGARRRFGEGGADARMARAREMGAITARRPLPKRHWRSCGDALLPTGAEALDEPFSAFPSWFMRITCDRCGKARMVNEAHTAHRDLPIRTILDRMHDGCGGRAGRRNC